jgi:signal transduction histidine kinase
MFGRWTRTTVTGLVVDLGQLAEMGTLRDRLASALGDRSLVVGYWLPEEDRYVDDAGRAVTVPEPGSEREVTIVGQDGQPVAALIHDPAVLDDRELIDSVASAAQLALSNVRLQAEIRRRMDELATSRRRIVEAADSQRRRLERQLRERVELRLAALEALIGDPRLDLSGREGFAAMLVETRQEIERAQDELLEFAQGIHPRVLTEGGLPAALAELVGRAPVSVELSAPDERYAPAVEAAIYFVCSEALANIGKYAQASQASIAVEGDDGRLSCTIEDDGIGGARLDAGSGLRGLADRVEALGGTLSVDSPSGEGTRLMAELPFS